MWRGVDSKEPLRERRDRRCSRTFEGGIGISKFLEFHIVLCIKTTSNNTSKYRDLSSIISKACMALRGAHLGGLPTFLASFGRLTNLPRGGHYGSERWSHYVPLPPWGRPLIRRWALRGRHSRGNPSRRCAMQPVTDGGAHL